MARSHVAVAVAFVLTTVVAYQIGRRRAPEPAEPARYDDSAGESEGEREADPTPTAPAAIAREADAASPIIILAPPPPPRPPRDILIVGKRPGSVADEPAVPEPEPPPVVAREPAAPAPAPSAVLNPEVTHSTFDEEDKVDRHPVPDRGSVTRSSFDDNAHLDHHPVP